MDVDWKEKVLRLAYSGSEKEEKEYVSLVDQAYGNVTLDIARVLMKTFSDEPDYGVQESVVRVLESANHEVYIQALLEELPRLLREAPQWAEALLGTSISFFHDALLKVTRQMNVQAMVVEAITRFSLQQNAYNGQYVLETLTQSNEIDIS